MADYSFVTIWQVRAPLEDVWEAIYHAQSWPSWWNGVERVEKLREGDEKSIGTIQRFTWKSRLPYRLTFDMETTRIEPMETIEGIARGELEGVGCWQFRHQDGITTAQYEWSVRTTKAWMNLLAPVTRPFFRWNHNVVMRWGEEGLRALLNTRGSASSHSGH